MHVLFIPSWYPATPGDTNGCFFREQAQALAASGLRVGVIAPALRSMSSLAALRGRRGLDVEDDGGVPTYRWHGVRAFSWQHDLNMRYWEHLGLQAYQAYVRDHGRPDVLHVHGMIFGLTWAAAIHRRHGVPFVVMEHSTEFALATIRSRLLDYLGRQLPAAAQLFAVSSDLCRRLATLLPVPAGQSWRPMPNLVAGGFTGSPAVTRARVAGPLRLLNVGILHPKKGQALLLQALRGLLDAGVPAHLRLCGDGAERASLQALAEQLGLRKHLTFLGNCSREQVAAEMADADLFVLSSLYETFGVVVIEALASGLPVLATRCGGPEDIVEPERDGLLVDAGSAAALTQGLVHLAARLPDLDRADIRARCIARFSEPAFVARHLRAYESARSEETR